MPRKEPGEGRGLGGGRSQIDMYTSTHGVGTYRPEESALQEELGDEFGESFAGIEEGKRAVSTTPDYGERGTSIPPVPPNTTISAPSLPSISNVGAVPFSGSINWNAIPGGFQPLPQVAGGKKKLYQLSQFHGGINQKSSPRDISDQESQEATNVSFSSIGKIKLLGDCLNTNAIGADVAGDSCDSGFPGYGLFQFTAPADHDAGNLGETVFTCIANGDEVDVYTLPDGKTTSWIDGLGTTDDTTVCQVYYASGNGLYVADANFAHGNASKAKIYVYREDQNETVSGWVQGNPLINSPTYDPDADAAMAQGTVKCTHNGGTATPHGSSTLGHGSLIADCAPTGTGSWEGTYYFYISWLFDGGVETNLTSFADDGGDDEASNGIAFDDDTLSFNVSLHHKNASPLGGDKRIEGARIYFKESGTSERFLLAELSMKDGVKSALDTTFIPWSISSDVHNLSADIVFDAPPSLYTYSALNGYDANELYDSSLDASFTDATCDYNNDPTITMDSTAKLEVGMYVYRTDDDTDIPVGSTVSSITNATTFELSTSTINGSHSNQTLHFSKSPVPHALRYKTAVVGQNGIVFIGNVKFRGKDFPDGMMYSMPNKPGVFPQLNFIDAASSDGSPITALAAFQDTILQFKENGLYVFNVSRGGDGAYAEAAFRNCGVANPCQVFTTEFGVIFANKFGCFVYDGQKVISLTHGKFDWLNQSGVLESTSNASDATVPCVGYDPRSQNIIVLKNIGDNADTTSATNEGAWIYNMSTQSWTEGSDMITNGDGVRHTNFIITADGYLAIKRSNDGTLLNYNHDKSVDVGAQTISYITKDLDFGLPSQTKKIFKVYVTYFSDNATVPTLTYGKDGAAPTSSFDSGAFASSGGLQTTEFKVTDTDLTGIKSLSLKIDGATDHSFEIQDISILYRARPIK